MDLFIGDDGSFALTQLNTPGFCVGMLVRGEPSVFMEVAPKDGFKRDFDQGFISSWKIDELWSLRFGDPPQTLRGVLVSITWVRVVEHHEDRCYLVIHRGSKRHTVVEVNINWAADYFGEEAALKRTPGSTYQVSGSQGLN